MTDVNRANLFKDVHFFQTPEGLLVGTIALVVLWLILKLSDRYGSPAMSLLVKGLRRPLILGFAVALYMGWLLGLMAKNLAALNDVEVIRVTSSIVIFVIGRALLMAGLKLLHSATFNRWLSAEVEDGRERAMMISLLDRVYTISVAVITLAAISIAMGLSPTAVGAALGGAGIGIGFGTQQISQNFLSGLMLFFNRPFAEGDWINVSTFQGTVERIGWYHTRICTFDQRPLYIPNSVFATTPIENPGRMYCRRIMAEIGLRYEDLERVSPIVSGIQEMLDAHESIDHSKAVVVNFNQWDSSSINVLVYAFTKTSDWRQWLAAQQDVFLKISKIVKDAGGDFAFPSTTLYPGTSPDAKHPLAIQLDAREGTIDDAVKG